jgi:hypothetical protein
MITDELREAVKRAIWTEGKARTADRLAYEERGPGADEVLTKIANDALTAALPLIRAEVLEEAAKVADEEANAWRDARDVAAAIRAMKGGEG